MDKQTEIKKQKTFIEELEKNLAEAKLHIENTSKVWRLKDRVNKRKIMNLNEQINDLSKSLRDNLDYRPAARPASVSS